MPPDRTEQRRELASLTREALELFRDLRANRLVTGSTVATTEARDRTPPEPSPAASGDSLEKIAAEVRACTLCRLGLGRTNAVPGEGAGRADLMVVGEGPGADEDRTGRPFVGKAGQMLTRMLERVLKLPRPEVFIANIIKCRPPGNRDPQEDEAAACRPYLDRQIAAVRPLAILALGRVAAQTLLGTTTAISRLRGQTFRLGGIEVFPTFHPAYLLRNEEDKALVHQDLLRLKARLEELARERGKGGE